MADQNKFDQYEREKSTFAVDWPTVGTGSLMILGAVVWFGVGLAGGVIFFYPPVLFVLGLVAVVKGLVNAG